MTKQALSPTDPQELLAAVLRANANTPNPRVKALLDSVIRHLHAFALEMQLTPEELQTGLDFLVEVGKETGPRKHEGILLADILGVSTLVQLQSARRALEAGGTEPALVGPFWRANQPLRPHGTNIALGNTPGERLTVTARILNLRGEPIPHARVETWQASPKGLYENQDPEQADMNLRARFECDAQGRFWFTTVKPAGYPVPTDGPCGDLLHAQQRHTMRPAHLHFIVIAPGYRVLATQIFDAQDPHAFDDVVFGAVGSLLRDFERNGEGDYQLDLEFKLEEGETMLPHCPLP